MRRGGTTLLSDFPLAADDFDLDCFLPELDMAGRFKLLMELLAVSHDIVRDLVGLKQLSSERLRVSLRGVECRGRSPP